MDGELEAMRKSATLIRREPDALFRKVEGYDAVFVDVSCALGLAPPHGLPWIPDAEWRADWNSLLWRLAVTGWDGTSAAWAAEGRRAAMIF